MAVTISSPVFKYKTIKGPLHKVPAPVKLILLLPLSIFCMSLAPLYLAAGIAAAAITAFLCRFTVREQLTDLKPAFYYALLMYVLSVLSNFTGVFAEMPHNVLSAGVLLPRREFLRIALRLVLIVQISALLFRTTSSLEIRDCIRIEIISLFLSFIPEIFETWKTINLAWKARGGKQELNKIRVTVFILISLSMEKASLKARAAAARQGGKR
jgi:energy-coupling factor transporter transmembrane protein EcfT